MQSELDPETRAKLFERFGRSFQEGDAVFQEGERADFVFLVDDGRVRLFRRTRARERSIWIFRPGDLLGEEALQNGAVRTASAVAITDVRLLALDRRTFDALITNNGPAALRILEQLARRLREAEEQLENSMLRDPSSRVINTLLRLARMTPSSAAEGGQPIEITPLEIASRVGLDVESVRRCVDRLKEGGYVQVGGETVTILDLDALDRLMHLLGVKEDVRAGLT